ncbi:hypothetical protein AVEN_169970-1 [Araneus ventricosus]|uniref:Uncharacterized protein n=1 Tax=Araneus ventricosus TaxID=182803 RepID=A0A4Y2M0M8_ARAVE|nr:hypothetical protein AVEN_169970-1 [Araneus ventricosus]
MIFVCGLRVGVRGFNTKNKKNIFYPNLSSAIRPVPHTSDIPVPHPPSSLDDIRSDSEHRYILPHQDESSSDFSVGSSKASLKAVLLHNGNSFASLPLEHSGHLEENYNVLSMILEKINYQEHRWKVCGDFKMLTMLLGQQASYTKYPCFLCLSDSRARDLHWSKTDWSLRGALTPDEKNVINTTLFLPEKASLPPLHIKLGLMKNFIKSLLKMGNASDICVQGSQNCQKPS